MNKLKLFFFLLLYFICLRLTLQSQSLTGTTGCVTIPTARMQEDRQITFGALYLDKKYLVYSKKEYNVIAPFITINYLPFLEVGLRINKMLFYYNNAHYTFDRMPSIRIKLLNEKKYFPALVIGFHDFVGAFMPENEAVNFNATYLVASKKIEFNSINKVVDVHLGFSSDIIKASHHQFLGLFGGTSIYLTKYITFLAEYDSRLFNIGTQLILFKHLTVTLGLLNFDSFNGGVAYKFQL